jgi:hypothetical protein
MLLVEIFIISLKKNQQQNITTTQQLAYKTHHCKLLFMQFCRF